MGRVLFLGSILLFSAGAGLSVQLRPGWKKVMVPPSEEVRVLQLGGEILFRYAPPSFYGTIVYIPVGVESQVTVQNVSPAVLDDRVGLPGGNIDPNVGVPASVPLSERATYPPGTAGLYLIVLVGAFTTEMLNPVWDIGVQRVDSIPFNGMLIVATPEQAERVRALTVVEFVEPYHPFYRCGSPQPVLPGATYFVDVEVPAPTDTSLLEYLRGAAVSNSIRLIRPGEFSLAILGKDFEAVRRHPLVVCVSVPSVDATAIPTLSTTVLLLLGAVLAVGALRRL